MDQKVSDTTAPRIEAPFVPPPGFKLTLFCLMLALFLGALNQTIVSSALPTIGQAFGDLANLSFVISTYFLFGTAIAPILGKLSDIYGRRPLMLWSVGLFLGGSLICALAPNMLTLIIGRAVQGLGGGGLFPLVHSTTSDLIPPSERGKYFIYNTLTWTIAALLGPVLGGVFAQYLHWSVIFWFNVPLGAAAMLLLARRLKGLPKPGADRDFDLIGGVMLTASAFVFLLCVTWGGVRYAWSSPTILMLAVATAVLIAIYVVRAHHIDEPFLPLSALRGRVVPWGIGGGSCALAALTGLSTFLPFYFQTVHGFSVADAGLALVPFVVSSVPGTMLASRALKGPGYKWHPVVGLLISAVTLALMVAVGHSLSSLWLIVLLCIAGTGLGPVFPIATIALQNAAANHQIGLVTSASHYFRLLASATAVAIAGTALLLGLGFSPFSPDAERLLFEVPRDRMIDVFAPIFAIMALISLAGAVCMALMEERPMRGWRHPSR